MFTNLAKAMMDELITTVMAAIALAAGLSEEFCAISSRLRLDWNSSKSAFSASLWLTNRRFVTYTTSFSLKSN